jgi:hypothetical protein
MISKAGEWMLKDLTAQPPCILYWDGTDLVAVGVSQIEVVLAGGGSTTITAIAAIP